MFVYQYVSYNLVVKIKQKGWNFEIDFPFSVCKGTT